MIKRIYYYFKIKELLEKSELMPFVEYLLKLKPEPENLFIFCMKGYRPIKFWFDYLVLHDQLKQHAKIFASGTYMEYHVEFVAETLKRRFNKANDFWKKTVKVS